MSSDNSQLSPESGENKLQHYKISIIGNGGVGKTTYINRLLTGNFSAKYVPTTNVDVNVLNFNTNYGNVQFTIYDTAGQENLKDEYLINSQGVIIMFDVTNNISFKKCTEYIDKLYKLNPESHIVICGNKIDIANGRKVSSKKLRESHSNYEKYEISAKSNYNFDKPFLYFARKITCYEDLDFVSDENIDVKVKKIIENKFQQHISNVDALFATGSFTIEKLKSTCEKTFYMMDDNNDDYQVNKLNELYFQLLGSIKLMQGQKYKLLLSELNDF